LDTACAGFKKQSKKQELLAHFIIEKIPFSMHEKARFIQKNARLWLSGLLSACVNRAFLIYSGLFYV